MQKVWIKAALQALVAGTSIVVAYASDTGSKTLSVHFRHADPAAQALPPLPDKSLTILADEDFAPFSFRNASGALAGISVELGAAACAAIQVKCQFVPKPFGELLAALEKKEGLVIVGGPAPTAALLQKFAMTRPYYSSSGQFVVRSSSTLQKPDPKSLAGKRLGYVKATAYEAFAKKYYERATLTPYDTEQGMLTALRSGTLEIAFTDSLHAAFWMQGSDARACCVALGPPITERDGLSRGLAMIVDKSRPDLVAALDRALDDLDEKSETAKIFSHYLPAAK